MIPEFSRRLRIDSLPPGGLEQGIKATPAECQALAARLQIPGIESLTGHYRLLPVAGGRVAATGRLAARLTRVCVVSLDDFAADLTDQFDLVFVPADLAVDDDDPDTPDEIPYEGGTIDLGEVTAEQLALVLEPYPRKPDAELPPHQSDTAETPFAPLARLRRPN